MKKRNLKTIIIVVASIIAIIVAGVCVGSKILDSKQEAKTSQAVIVKSTEKAMAPEETGKVRVKVAQYIVVDNAKMLNFNFQNLNKGRLMSCKMYLEEKCIYASPYLEAGKCIVEDVIDDSDLKEGKNNVKIEIYTYSEDKTMQLQTNYEIILDKKAKIK